MATGNISDASLKYFQDNKIKVLLEEAMHDVIMQKPEDPLSFLLAHFEKRTPLRLIIAGPPGCGKGTQCELLESHYGVKHLSVGDLLRQEVDSGSEVGQKIAPFVKEGKLVPDDLFVDLVIKRIKEIESLHQGWVLDGFPRSRAQSIYLQRAGISPQKFLYIDLPDSVATERALSRVFDPNTRKTYNTASAPPPDGVQTVKKIDDSPEAVGMRLKYFAARKDELIECYSPFYVRIDGTLDTNGVFQEIKEQIDSLEIVKLM
ncbi:adenylate kinase [Angomonas deanei]|nr:adenylate kinase [Angomonas deanei]|eukprot:EPY40373.1 adenylate kinase [Angomonas deanei]